MNFKGLSPILFRSGKFQEREDYVRDSLSSLAVTSRLSCFSSSNGLKTDPFSLRFHDEWRNNECKVIKWYDRIAPSTQITSVEHRKTLEAPFFHEFLLIYLTDGAVCRLERMGDGSRVDAVRWLGCTAHDIIQWFPFGQYPTTPLALQPSEVVIHVQFPRTFDLLDVLAICYSIKRHRRASIYTLQRYNCYFLCNTILAILTRRVAEWETKLITTETWPKLVDAVLWELPRKTHDDEHEYLGIDVCSLLEPDCPNLVNDVVELLRSELKSGAHDSVAMSIAETLWRKDLQPTIRESLSQHVDAAANKAIDSGDGDAINLKTLFVGGNNELYANAELRNPTVQRMLIKHNMATLSKYERRHALDSFQIYKMKKIEHGGGASRSIELLCSVIGPFVNWWTFNVDLVRCVPGAGDKLDIRARAQFELSRITSSLSIGGLTVLYALDDDFEAVFDESTDKKTHALLLVSYELCRLPVIDTRSKVLCVLNNFLERKEWTYSLRYSFSRLLMEALSDLTNSGVILVLESGPKPSQYSIIDMHDHLQRRIHEHAKRVEGYQLAAAQLVEDDIMREMSEIWKSLPHGFGGGKTEC